MKLRRSVFLLLLLVAVAAVASCYELLRAATVLYSFSLKKDPPLVTLYLRCFGYETTSRDLVISGAKGPIRARVYEPQHLKAPPTILLVHGFAPEGFRHPVLNTLAVRLARTGLRVVIPTIEGESKFQMTTSDLQLIDDSITWSFRAFGQPVSVLGISFGGALAINAAAQPPVAHLVKMIVCISGYNSLDAIGHYYIHDRLYEPSGKPYRGDGPPTGPILFTSQYLDEMVPGIGGGCFSRSARRLQRACERPYSSASCSCRESVHT